ncbi:probable protein S-acyltransferase 7 [Aristolochia californica]|uniref:probable protein S-acyltransferase 7 n=1 Tax=Aristolochia californica TaxID=171875 RepID=UPI0035DF5F18
MEGKVYVTPPPRHLSDSNRRIIDSNGPPKRVYQLWKGSNRFFLGGRLIFGPDVRSLLFTILLIIVPVIMFAVFVSHKLVEEFQQNLGNLIVILAVVFALYILCLLLLASGRDPGIIPRRAHPPEPEDDGEGSLSADWVGTQGVAPALPPTKDVLVNGIVVKVKYCHTCMLYRPPRCSHCSICNNCVERFDHHCPWVGQCIGKRNYRFFFMFVSSTTLLCLYVFAFCWVNVKYIMGMHDCNLWKAFLKVPLSGILIIYTFVAAWFVGGLTAFHLYLICTNQTTYENFRYRYDGKMNPYNRGLAQNIREVFFSTIPPSKNNFRARVKEDSSAFTPSHSLGRALSPEMAKRSFDLEMGAKRQAVAAEEFEEIQNQMGLERCGTQPRREDWGHKGNWGEITPEIQALAVEFGMDNGNKDREKLHGNH